MPPTNDKHAEATALLDGLDDKALIRDLGSRIVANRRAIHANPERGLTNPDTQQLIIDELKRIGIKRPGKGKALTSVVCDIKGERGKGRTVLLRADMDALPLTESSDLPWASKKEGVMHACGHDGHTAMLIGAAELLYARRDRFAGTVRLMFQPGEEGYGGAKHMIEEGVLDGVDAAFAIHLEPSRPPHEIHTRIGAILAGDSMFSVVFKGAGGHASMPHHTRDPIPALGPFIDGLSHAAARETDPDDRAVFSVTRVEAGTAINVIPPTARCAGTIRTLSIARRDAAEAQLRRIAEGVAASRGLEVEVKVGHGYIPTINHAYGVERVRRGVQSIGLTLREMPSAVMGAEDFSYVLEKVPGAMVFLGAHAEGAGPLHSDRMAIDESVLVSGARMHVAAAAHMLAG